MKTAVVLVVSFALFIALVEWRRHYAERGLSRGLDARVSVERPPRAVSRSPSASRGAEGAPLSAAAPPDAGAPSEAEPPASRDAEHPRDRDAERKKAEAAMDAIQRLMDAERRDESWAAGVEAWARAHYAVKPGSRLERVECKKTLCSADGTHDTDQLYADWVARFTGRERSLRVMTMPDRLPSGRTHARSFILRDESSSSARR